ncbi:hypothetical protein N9980_01215 [bacterium]|nr:hypothetical protein [bacterium]
MDTRIVTALIALVAGLVSGIFVSLVAPWAKWHFQRIRLQTDNRKQRIQEWRADIDRCRRVSSFMETSTYSQLANKLPKRDYEWFSRTILDEEPNPEQERIKVLRFHEVVDEIELEWKLI